MIVIIINVIITIIIIIIMSIIINALRKQLGCPFVNSELIAKTQKDNQGVWKFDETTRRRQIPAPGRPFFGMVDPSTKE